jgi:hypothetical protein
MCAHAAMVGRTPCPTTKKCAVSSPHMHSRRPESRSTCREGAQRATFHPHTVHSSPPAAAYSRHLRASGHRDYARQPCLEHGGSVRFSFGPETPSAVHPGPGGSARLTHEDVPIEQRADAVARAGGMFNSQVPARVVGARIAPPRAAARGRPARVQDAKRWGGWPLAP